MKRIREIALAASMVWTLVQVSGSHASEDKFTMQIDKVIVEPGVQIQQGKAAVIRCQWSAKFLPDGSSTKKTVNQVVKPSGFGGIEVKIQTARAATDLKRFDRLSKPGYYKAESPLGGEFKAEWIPATAGPASVTCFVVSPWTTSRTVRAEKSLPVVVAPASIQVASSQVTSSPEANGVVGTGARSSNLEILQATGAPTADCGTISGHFLTMKLTIKNSGRLVQPDHGIVRIRAEYGTYPDNLSFSSGDVALPEIKEGPANVIEVPVSLANFKPEKVTMLAGTTLQFQAELLSRPNRTFAHVKALIFPVSFPKGLCATAAARPAAPAVASSTVSAQRTPRAAQAPETTPGPAPPASIPITPRR